MRGFPLLKKGILHHILPGSQDMNRSKSSAIFSYDFSVPDSALDANGHVNNVNFVQWMQDAAVRHFSAMGGVPLIRAVGATWVVRSHVVEYLAPAFRGDTIEVRTWVANIRRVRSLRRYQFSRKSDGSLLVRGETEWVFVDANSLRPLAMPPEVTGIFSLIEDGAEG